MPRYIDADVLLERLKFKRDTSTNLDGRKRYGLDSAISQVRKAPTADVVEVVRCKDCKHYDMRHVGDGRALVFRCTHQLGLRCPSEDNWCNFGER